MAKKQKSPGKTPSPKGKKVKQKMVVDEGYVSMNNQLATLGLELREVPGDGNCLFRALGDQIDGHVRNHYKHRQDVVQYMRKYRSDFEPFVEDNVTFEKHVSNLGQLGTYAGNDAIVAFARLHGATIVIHQLNTPLWQIHGCESGKSSCEMHIAYHNGDHYNSIRSLGDSGESPANIRLLSQLQLKNPLPQLAHSTSSSSLSSGDEAQNENYVDSKSSLWSMNGTGTRIFGTPTPVNGGAKPKVLHQDSSALKSLTNSQTKQMKRQERRDKKTRQAAFVLESSDSDEVATVAKHMECLSI